MEHFTPLSHRDVIQALALRRAQQLGIELPWYNHQTTDENQGDLPWLDPFSAITQPRIVPHVSSSSQSAPVLLETSGDTAASAQPPGDPGSPVMLNDDVLTDAPPPVFRETNLTRQDVDVGSTAAQQSEAASLVASVLTKAILVVSSLRAPELAGQDISSNATQPYCDRGSLVTSNDAELAECDNKMNCENLSPHQYGEEAAERTNRRDDHELAMHTTLSAEGSRNSFCSSTSSSSNDCLQFSCSQDSTQSLISSEHLSLHQVGLTEQCVDSGSKHDDCNLDEDETLPGEALLEAEESFYSSKSSNSEEQCISVIHVNTISQSADRKQLNVVSADQYAKCDDDSADNSGAEKQPPGDAVLQLCHSTPVDIDNTDLVGNSSRMSKIDDQCSIDFLQDSTHSLISSEHLSLHQVGATEQHVYSGSNCDNNNLGEDKLVPEEALLEVEESSSNINEEQSASEVQSVDCELQLKVDSSKTSLIDGQSPSGHNIYQDSLQSIICTHLSLHQMAPDTRCVHTVPISSDSDDHDLSENKSQPGEASLVANELLQGSSSEEKASADFHQLEDSSVQSTDCDQLSVASADQYAKSSGCDSHSASGSEADSDCDLGEKNPPPKEASLESFYSYKSSNSEEESSLDIFHHSVNTVQSANCEQLSATQLVASVDQCPKYNISDVHSTDESGTDTVLECHSVPVDGSIQCSTDLVDLVLPLKLEASPEVVDSLQMRKSDDDSSSEFSQDSSTQSLIGSDHQSLHQVGSAEQCVIYTGFKCDDREERASLDLEVEQSFYSSKSGNSDEQGASELHDNGTQTVQTTIELRVASAEQHDDQQTCELDAEMLPLEGNTTHEVNDSVSGNDLVEPTPSGSENAPLEMKISTIDDQSSSEFYQDSCPSIDKVQLSLHQMSASQCTVPIILSSCADGHDLSENKSLPGVASLEANDSLCSSKASKSEEESSSDIHQLEDNTVQPADREQPSVASADQYDNCDTHSIDDSGAESDHSLYGNKSPPVQASLAVEESFYSSKSSNDEELSGSVIHIDNTVQSKHLSVASADQCTKSNDNGNAVLQLHCSVSVDVGDQSNNQSELIEYVPPPVESKDAPVDVNTSRTSQIIDDESSSDYFQGSIQGSIQSMDKHFSLHQVASSTPCLHTVSSLSSHSYDSNEDQSGSQPQQEVSPEVQDESCYSSKPISSSKEESSSDVCQECENLSSYSAVSSDSVSDKPSRFDDPPTRDVDEIIAASLEFRQMVYDSRSSICRIRHIYSNYNLAEYNPLVEDCSLEVNVSAQSFKTSRSDSSSRSESRDKSTSCQAMSAHSFKTSKSDSCSRFESRDDKSFSCQASVPSVCSEARMNASENCSTSDFCLYITRSIAYERLSLNQVASPDHCVCTSSSRSSSCDDHEKIQRSAAALELTLSESAYCCESSIDHTNHDQDNVVDKPLPTPTSQASIHSTKMRFSDDGSSSAMALPHENHQEGEQPSSQLLTTDQFIESSSNPSRSHSDCSNGHNITDHDVGTEKPQAADALPETSSSGFHPDTVQNAAEHHPSSPAHDQFLQSSSVKSLKSDNGTGCSNEHVCITIEDTDYFTALSSQCSSEQAGSENVQTDTSHGASGITMEPCAHSRSRSSSHDYYGLFNSDETIQLSAAALNLTTNQSAYSTNINQASQSDHNVLDEQLHRGASLSLEATCTFDGTSDNGDCTTQSEVLPGNIHIASGEHLTSTCQPASIEQPSCCNDHNTHAVRALSGDALQELQRGSSNCSNVIVSDEKSPPEDASPEPSSDTDNGNFHQDSRLASGSEHQASPYQVSSTDHSFYSFEGVRISNSSDYHQHSSDPIGSDCEHPCLQQVEATVQRLPRFSEHQLSPVGSVVSTKDETCIIMEIDEAELPHIYDNEPAVNVSTSHITVMDSSTDYYTALSQLSSGHESGPQLVVSPVGSVLSTDDEVRIIMEPEELESPSDDSNNTGNNNSNAMLKMSSSTSLFIPRGFSNGPVTWNSSGSLTGSLQQRNDSTATFHSVMMQLSGSSASEEDKENRPNQDPQLPPPIYEPY